MNFHAVAIGTVIVGLVVGANVLGWQAIRAPELPESARVTSQEALTWDSLAGITASGSTVRFPEALVAREGTVVELVGVLFPLPQLIVEGKLTGAVFAAPAKFACCGLTCESRSLSLMMVIPPEPLADPGRKRLARVRGTLVLHRQGGSWSTVDVTGATIEFLPDP